MLFAAEDGIQDPILHNEPATTESNILVTRQSVAKKQPVIIDVRSESGNDSLTIPDQPHSANHENDTVGQNVGEIVEPNQIPEPVIISPQPRLIIDEGEETNTTLEDNDADDAGVVATGRIATLTGNNMDGLHRNTTEEAKDDQSANLNTHSAKEQGIAQVLVDAASSTPALDLNHVEIKQERLSPVQDVLARRLAANTVEAYCQAQKPMVISPSQNMSMASTEQINSSSMMSRESDPLLCDASLSSTVVKAEKDFTHEEQVIRNTIQSYLIGSETQIVTPDIKEEDDKKNIPLIKTEPSVGSVMISATGNIVNAPQQSAVGSPTFIKPLSVGCLWCKSTFSSLVELLNHLFVYGYQASTQAFKCWYCQKDYEQEGAWHSHLQTAHHKLSLLTCGICRQHFHMETDLRLHNVIHHDDPAVKKRKLRRKAEPHKNKVVFECPVCKLSMIMCLPLVAYEHLITHQGREITNDNLGTFRLPSEDPLKGMGNSPALNQDKGKEIMNPEVDEKPTFIVTTESRWRRPANKVVTSDLEAAQLNPHREVTAVAFPQLASSARQPIDQTALLTGKKRPASPLTTQVTKVHKSDIPSNDGKVRIIDPAKQSKVKVQLKKLSEQKLEKFKVPGTNSSFKIPDSAELLDTKPAKSGGKNMREAIKLYHYPQTVTPMVQMKETGQQKLVISIPKGGTTKVKASKTSTAVIPHVVFGKDAQSIDNVKAKGRCCKVFGDPLKSVPKEMLEWTDTRMAFACVWCKQTFPKPYDFIQHLKQHCKHGGGGVFICHGCTALFSSELQLYKHALYVHTNSGRNSFKCNKCDTTFCIPSGLLFNILLPSGIREFHKLNWHIYYFSNATC